MRRVGAGILMLACFGCETERPIDPPAPAQTHREEHVDDAPMTLEVHRVSADDWAGRVVVASFAPHDRSVRVVPSDGPRALDAIVGPIGAPQPFAAINGGFYDMNGAPMGLVRTGARDVAALRENGGSGVFFVDDGTPRIVHRDAYRSGDEIREAVQSIDRIVADGRSVVSPNASDRRAARSAIAIDHDGWIHLVVAFDDRAIGSEEEARIVLDEDSGTSGPTLGEMAALLMRSPREGGVSARDALGLDGGFSTSMTVKSARHALRIEAYRATINAIVVHAARD